MLLVVCADGVKGGVESAFMSTTFEREVAMQDASEPGKPALVFEVQMGMIDRGAELGWISQYPHEKECLFAPLTGAPPTQPTCVARLAGARSKRLRCSAQVSRCWARTSTERCS